MFQFHPTKGDTLSMFTYTLNNGYLGRSYTNRYTKIMNPFGFQFGLIWLDLDCLNAVHNVQCFK